jgi:two-component system phosphate regulon sensor histidine kinase PhoR
MRNSWVEEFWQLILVALLGTVLGLLLGHLWLVLTLFLLAYVVRNLYNLQRLIHWLNNPGEVQIPNQFGIWGTIYARIERMRTGHLQREQELRQLLSQFEASAAALPDAAVALGSHGEIRWCNKAAGSMLKLRTPQDIGQPLVNLFRAPELTAYLSRGDFEKPLDVAAPGDKQRKLSIRVTDYGRQERLLVAQDVTDRLMAEQIRKDFVANVSHELRTPLTVISGFVENMQIAEDQIPPQWEKPLELIAEQAERMRSIVEDLLLLARLEGTAVRAPATRVDIAELVSTIAKDGQALAGDRVQILVDITSKTEVSGDGGLLRSAFTNLIVNAINHTPDGGEIRVSWKDDGQNSVFSVEDTGEGIASEHIPRLTERFYRVDVARSRARGGTGLGLAIVKHILQQHEAHLKVESHVGQGSRFSCVFPANRCFAEGR